MLNKSKTSASKVRETLLTDRLTLSSLKLSDGQNLILAMLKLQLVPVETAKGNYPPSPGNQGHLALGPTFICQSMGRE